MPNQDNRLDSSGLSYLWSKLKAVFSNKADKADTVLDTTLSMGRKSGMTVGSCSTALGSDVTASGEYSHAEGYNTVSSGSGSHAEGKKTASGSRSYGNNSYGYGASGEASHSEGYNTTSKGSYSHTEGINTLAINNACHAEGHSSVSYGSYSHAEGCTTQAYGQYSHAEGYSSNATSSSYGARGKADHAEGYNTLANSGSTYNYYGAHAEGNETQATSNGAHAEGRSSIASGTYSHSEGFQTKASSSSSHAEGFQTTASGSYSHAEGYNTTASGEYSHAGGHYTVASNSYSYAEGCYSQAIGFYSHAEGFNTKAGLGGHNVGVHAFGRFNIGFDKYAVTVTDDIAVEWEPHKMYRAFSCVIRYTNDGITTYYVPHIDVPAYNDPSWDISSAFWHSYTLPSGTDPETIPEWDKDSLYPAYTVVKKTFADNVYYFQNHNEVATTYIPLTTSSFYHVVYLNNLTDIWPSILEEVGNGVGNGSTSPAGSRSNARTLDLSGNERLMGDVYVGCNPDSTGGSKLARVSELPNVSGKADKVSNATNGNFASLDANGNLVDSGKKASDFMEGMTILSYGNSTWADFLAAYTANKVVYCRASSNSNPATGSQTRLAFMAYVNNADSPTEVEFQYYRSVSSHSSSQQGDQVYVYKLTSSGTWTVTVREAMSKIAAGTNISLSYASGTITLSATDTTYSDMSGATASAAGTSGLVPAPSAGDQDKVLKGDGTWGTVSALPVAPSSDGTYFLQCTVTNGVAAYSWVSMPNANGVSF